MFLGTDPMAKTLQCISYQETREITGLGRAVESRHGKLYA